MKGVAVASSEARLPVEGDQAQAAAAAGTGFRPTTHVEGQTCYRSLKGLPVTPDIVVTGLAHYRRVRGEIRAFV